jgi:hypothetical protein
MEWRRCVIIPILLCFVFKLCNEEFTNLEEFRLFCRRADKLLPETLADIDEYVRNCDLLTAHSVNTVTAVSLYSRQSGGQRRNFLQ